MEYTDPVELQCIIKQWEPDKDYYTYEGARKNSDSLMPTAHIKRPSDEDPLAENSQLISDINPQEYCRIIAFKIIEDALKAIKGDEEDIISRTKSLFSQQIRSTGTLAETDDEGNASLLIYLFRTSSFIKISVSPKASVEVAKKLALEKLRKDKQISVDLDRLNGTDYNRLPILFTRH
jgi:hypothetical protein